MIGIIAAMNSEYALFKKNKSKLFNGKKYKIVKSGVGRYAAAKATNQLINLGCDTILGWGFAGGLAKESQCGQIIITNNFVSENRKYSFETPLYQELKNQIKSLDPTEGILFASDKPILDEKKKQELGRKFNSIAVDMESQGIISVVNYRKIPYLTIRVILDDSFTTLPRWISTLLEERSLPKKIRLLTMNILMPSESLNLIRLIKLHNRAAKQLYKTSALLTR